MASMIGPGGESHPFRVTGRVHFANGLAAINTTIVAVDRDLRSAQTLGRAETDRQGTLAQAAQPDPCESG